VDAQARRALVGMLGERGISVRRACVLLSVARSAVAYHAIQVRKDQPLLRLLRRMAAQHPRYGYRRAWAWLKRQGYHVNRKRVYRLWCAAGLALPHSQSRRQRRRGPRIDPVAHVPNAVWAADIVHDRCATGQVLRCLTVVDEYTRECLAVVVAGRLDAGAVVQCLAELVDARGAPHYLRTDNGAEFVARRTQAWLAVHRIQAARIAPGQPWQNGVVESFHSRLRDECLNREWFGSRQEAAVIIEQYRRAYNTTRLHSSLGYRTPAEARRDATQGDTGFRSTDSQKREPVSLLVDRKTGSS